MKKNAISICLQYSRDDTSERDETCIGEHNITEINYSIRVGETYEGDKKCTQQCDLNPLGASQNILDISLLFFSLHQCWMPVCHMFSKHLNSCTCLNNLRIKSTKPFFEVKLSEHMSWEYAVIEKCEELLLQRNGVKMWAGFYWISTGLISDLLWTSNEPSGSIRIKTLLEQLKKN